VSGVQTLLRAIHFLFSARAECFGELINDEGWKNSIGTHIPITISKRESLRYAFPTNNS
jgi:hypothetical protein